MNDLELYEQIPEEEFPVRLLDYTNDSFRFCLHWHEHTEIHFIFNGSAKIRCGDKNISLKKNDCVIINGNELHEGLGGSCDYGCIILPPSFFEKSRVIFGNIINDEVAAELITQIFSEHRAAGRAGSFAIKGYTYLLVARLIERHTVKTLTETTYRQYYERNDRINKVIQYISEHFTENITTAGLAEMMHLSEGHFCHVFKEVTGKTAKEYINAIRIKKAAALLSGTDMTVTETAYCCGFSDANYFARTFKKHTGSTPGSVRR